MINFGRTAPVYILESKILGNNNRTDIASDMLLSYSNKIVQLK